MAIFLIGAVVGSLVISTGWGGYATYDHLVLGWLVFLASSLCGFVLGVIGLRRDGRLRALSWIGLLLNAAPFLVTIVNLNWRLIL